MEARCPHFLGLANMLGRKALAFVTMDAPMIWD